jgi:hypothetical protein
MHNMYEAYYRVYAAMNVRDIDGILRPQNTQMPKDPATENADVLDGMQLRAFAGQQHDAHILAHLMMGLSPMLQANPMSAMELQKHILSHVRLKAEEDAEAQLFMAYGTDPDRMVSDLQREAMVALKEQELKIRAQSDMANQQIDRQRLQIEQQRTQATMQANQARIASQERIAEERAQVARERASMMDRNMRRAQNVQALNQRRNQNAA